MNSKRKYLILAAIGIISMLIFSTNVPAESYSDNSGDVAHWAGSTTGWGWTDINIADRPNIDIKEIRQNVVGDSMIIELEVQGSIQDSEKFFYWIAFNSSDAYYWVSWANGEGAGIGMKLGDMTEMSQPTVTKEGGTITATFDIVGEDTISEEFWGYAWEYTTLGDVVTSEWWGDWAPNGYTPFDEGDIIDEDEPDDDQEEKDPGDDETDGEEDEGEGANGEDSTNGGSSPGFELILLLAAFAIIIIVYRKKK